MSEFVEPGAAEEGGRRPDLPRLLARVVRPALPWMIGLVLLGAAGGLAAGLLQPNRYVSNAKLLLRMGAREQLTAESLVDVEPREPAPLPTMADELALLSDARIFEGVAREIGPSELLAPADPRREDGPETSVPVRLMHAVQAALLRSVAGLDADPEVPELRAATRLLLANTLVTNEPRSSVILLSSRSSSPEAAREIVRRLAEAFIARHREQYSIRALLERSREQIEESRQARELAAKLYVEHSSQSGISVLESSVPRLETALAALEAERFAAGVRREELGRVRSSLERRLDGIPVEVEIQRPAVMIPNEEYETQLALQRLLLAQKQELLIQSRPSEETRRRERAFDEQIAKVDQRLKATPRAVAQGSDLQENLGHTAMQARILDAEVEDEALVVKLGLLETRIAEQRAGLGVLQARLVAATLDRKDLAARRDAAESRHARLEQRFALLEGLDTLDARQQANLSVLQAPTLEFEKTGPMRGGLFLKGLLFGLVAAMLLAFARPQFERRLAHPESFELARGLPVIGIVRRLPALERACRPRRGQGSPA